MTRRGVYWYLRYDEHGGDRLPCYLGAVEQVELAMQFTVVPFNLVIAWARHIRRGLIYYWLPKSRWEQNRRAIRMATERGRRGGFNQGKAHAQMQLGRMIDDQLTKEYGPR